MKILVITSQVIDERNYNRFGLDYIDKKSSLSVLDLTPLFYPKVYKINKKFKKNHLKVFHIHSRNELNEFFLNINKYNFVISMIGELNQDTLYIYSKLKSFKNKLIIFALNSFPRIGIENEHGSIKRIIAKIIRERSIFGIINKIIFVIRSKVFSKNVIKADYIITCGTETKKNFHTLINNKTKLIPSCSYDFILSKKKYIRKIKHSYFLFLDENIIKHTDFITRNEIVENENIYYYELKKFFKFLENKFNIKVIIAAHPRANIKYTKNKFLEFDVFENETPSLVKYSKACITSASTSSNFAVIFNKPIIFITTNRMKKTRPSIETLAKCFSKVPVNISENIDFDIINSYFSLHDQSYKKYLKNYISWSNNTKFGLESIERELIDQNNE